MKKILFAASVFVAFITGCVKDKTINTDGFNNTATNVEIIPYSDNNGFTGGGLESFSKATVQTSGTATVKLFFVVNVAGTNGAALGKDITVTTAVDDAARVSYNSTSTDKYDPIPDSCYSYPVKSNTLKAGSYLDTFYIYFYPTKIDPSKNYMAAITLKDASGVPISSNFSTVYFHTLGNPLAGPYTTTGARYNYTGASGWTGPPAPYPAGYTNGTTAAYSGTVVASPVNTKTIKLVMGNVPDPAPVGGSAYYYITGNSTFSSITYDLGANFAAGYSNIQTYITSYTPPSATQKPSFHLITLYNNATGGAGNDRIIDQTFVHQ